VKIYVGNLPFEIDDESLAREFEVFGEVVTANVVMDRASGRSRGFGFVEMPTQAEAEAAIAGLNGKDMNGRPLSVNESRPREGGGGGGGFGGGAQRRRY